MILTISCCLSVDLPAQAFSEEERASKHTMNEELRDEKKDRVQPEFGEEELGQPVYFGPTNLPYLCFLRRDDNPDPQPGI